MSWAMYHTLSENHASQAEIASGEGNLSTAILHYRLAAEQETTALAQLDASKIRTIAITIVSAASLWFKAREYEQAEALVYQGLANSSMPTFALKQLKELLQAIWKEQALTQSNIQFTEGEVIVAVSGGEVLIGGAPMDLIQRKVDEVGRIFFRTIEMLLNQPFRRRGAPSPEIQEQFRPWLLQVPAGSYQFAVRVERPRQMPLFPDSVPQLEVEQISRKVLEIVQVSTNDPEGRLVDIVPNSDYRTTFLKLARNLAPVSHGKTFNKIELRSAQDTTLRPVVLIPEDRETLNQVIRKVQFEQLKADEHREEEELKGVLRGLQLDQDWLEISVADDERGTIKIHNAGDAIDDVVGPMVNQRVIVTAVKRTNGTYVFRDIQPVE